MGNRWLASHIKYILPNFPASTARRLIKVHWLLHVIFTVYMGPQLAARQRSLIGDSARSIDWSNTWGAVQTGYTYMYSTSDSNIAGRLVDNCLYTDICKYLRVNWCGLGKDYDVIFQPVQANKLAISSCYDLLGYPLQICSVSNMKV